MSRPSWSQYFMEMAKLVSTRSTCPRASVGAVLVKDNIVISTGYNGAPPGEAHCTDVGCDVVDNHCLRTVHAETNAVAQAARNGTATLGSVMYMYDSQSRPSCPHCDKIMKSAGVQEVVYYFKPEEIVRVIL